MGTGWGLRDDVLTAIVSMDGGVQRRGPETHHGGRIKSLALVWCRLAGLNDRSHVHLRCTWHQTASAR